MLKVVPSEKSQYGFLVLSGLFFETRIFSLTPIDPTYQHGNGYVNVHTEAGIVGVVLETHHIEIFTNIPGKSDPNQGANFDGIVLPFSCFSTLSILILQTSQSVLISKKKYNQTEFLIFSLTSVF
jgi:hypothetical protein